MTIFFFNKGNAQFCHISDSKTQLIRIVFRNCVYYNLGFFIFTSDNFIYCCCEQIIRKVCLLLLWKQNKTTTTKKSSNFAKFCKLCWFFLQTKFLLITGILRTEAGEPAKRKYFVWRRSKERKYNKVKHYSALGFYHFWQVYFLATFSFSISSHLI